MGHQATHTVIQPVFTSLYLQAVFDCTWLVLRPWLRCFNQAVGPFLPVTPERSRPGRLWFGRLVLTPIYAVIALATLLPVLFVFVVRNFLHQFRQPYCEIKSIKCNIPTEVPKSTFSVATANLCLLPEFMAKFNNLHKTAERARKIGELIYTDQVHYQAFAQRYVNKRYSEGVHDGAGKDETVTDTNNSLITPDFNNEVKTHFPQTDFLCLQETFDADYTKQLLHELEKIYPYIVYDVGYSSPRVNYCGLSSGLCVASMYEIERIKFQPFSTKCGFCSIIGKGLVMLKVPKS